MFALILLLVLLLVLTMVRLGGDLSRMSNEPTAEEVVDRAFLRGARAELAALNLRCERMERDIRELRHGVKCYLDQTGAGPVFLRAGACWRVRYGIGLGGHGNEDAATGRAG
jgi:Tfp pilus assembly protein PilX